MSWTSLKDLTDIIGKNVFVFDLETTDVIKSKFGKPEYKFPNPKSVEYENVNIVEISWFWKNNFNYCQNDFVDDFSDNLWTDIIKPDNFTISNSHIHGITQEIAESKGIRFDVIISKLRGHILNSDYIIGFNVFFDVNILLSKLYKFNYIDLVNKINRMILEHKVLCMGVITSQYAKPNGWVQRFKYQIPKQVDVYVKCYGTLPPNAHSAKFDVIALCKIIYHIYGQDIQNKITNEKTNRALANKSIDDENIKINEIIDNDNKIDNDKIDNNNKINKFENVGKKWTVQEVTNLKKEVRNSISIEEICELHGRSQRGIKMAIKKYCE